MIAQQIHVHAYIILYYIILHYIILYYIILYYIILYYIILYYIILYYIILYYIILYYIILYYIILYYIILYYIILYYIILYYIRITFIFNLELLTPHQKYGKYNKCDFLIKWRLYKYKLKMNDHWNTIITFVISALNKNIGNSIRNYCLSYDKLYYDFKCAWD